MKKILVSVILSILCLSASLSAFSWSGIVDNNSKLSANNDFSAIALDQSNGIYLAAKSKLNESGSLRFSAEGLYKYSLDCAFKEKKASFMNIADLDLLKFSGDWNIQKGLLSVNLGRFKYSDFSGVVFSQASDGLYAAYDTLKTKTSVYAGYTGFLNRLNVSMVEKEVTGDGQFYAFCPKYIPVMADFAYKALLEKNTVGLQLAAYLPASSDYTMKIYGTLIGNGYIGTIASYDVKVTLGTEKFDGLMLDAKFDTNFYVNSNVVAGAGAEYVSGGVGFFKPFATLSTRSFGASPLTDSVIVPKLSAMYVKDKLYGSVTERVLISMEDEVKLHGFDTAVTVLYNLFSDVQLGGDIGVYISKEKELSNYFATIKASLAF